MTREPFLGVVGRRLVAAFTIVAATAIALITVAALVGTDRGLSRQLSTDRQQLTENLAAVAARAYSEAGSWQAADLSELWAAVAGTGTGAVLQDADGALIVQHGMGRHGNGAANGMNDDAGATGSLDHNAPVTVADRQVGLLTLTFAPESVTTGRPVAWSWVLAAAAGALALALASGVVAARELTRPVLALTAATRAFAAGDREARPDVRGPGELDELATAFDEAATAIQAAETARRQLAADVAHELRTPLAALQAGLEELRDGLAPADPPALARLHDQSLRLGRIIGDLAELSSAEAAGRTLVLEAVEDLDLADLVRAECAAREPQLRAAGLDLHRELDDGATVRADPHRMHQVVGNLLENCIRHCGSGDRVEIRVETGRPRPGSPGTVTLTVADDGPGISAADLPHVTERFWRSAQARNRSVGSGLGLAIVAELVRAHHGTIDVSSPGRRGTTVRIALPAVLRNGPRASV